MRSIVAEDSCHTASRMRRSVEPADLVADRVPDRGALDEASRYRGILVGVVDGEQHVVVAECCERRDQRDVGALAGRCHVEIAL